MASKRSSSPIRGDRPEAKKSKVVAESVPDNYGIPIMEPMTDEQWKAWSEEVKEWLKERETAKRDDDGITDDDLARFHYLIHPDRKAGDKPSIITSRSAHPASTSATPAASAPQPDLLGLLLQQNQMILHLEQHLGKAIADLRSDILHLDRKLDSVVHTLDSQYPLPDYQFSPASSPPPSFNP